MKFNFKKFGEAVKFKRTAGITGHDKPFTLKELESETGVQYTGICRLEAGGALGLESILTLADWAGLNIYDFTEK